MRRPTLYHDQKFIKKDLVIEVVGGLFFCILKDLYICRGVKEMIVEGPADVLGSVNANWSKILVRVSNDDIFISTNQLYDLCLKLCDV